LEEEARLEELRSSPRLREEEGEREEVGDMV
jgi:hypothetical protein